MNTYIDYEDDETELVVGGDRVIKVKKDYRRTEKYLKEQSERGKRWRENNPEKYKACIERYHQTEQYRINYRECQKRRYYRLKRLKQKENADRQTDTGESLSIQG